MEELSSQLEEHFQAHVDYLVRSGFETREAGVEHLAMMFDDEVPDAGLELRTRWFDRLEQRYSEREEAERSWTTLTENDRITLAFQSMTAEGILALECAGYTMSDGWEDIAEMRRFHPDAWAGAFFHRQDVERALAGNSLLIAFGAFSRGDDHEALSLQAGERIVEVLADNDIAAMWAGTLEQRITIEPFEWKRRTLGASGAPPAVVPPPPARLPDPPARLPDPPAPAEGGRWKRLRKKN